MGATALPAATVQSDDVCWSYPAQTPGPLCTGNRALWTKFTVGIPSTGFLVLKKICVKQTVDAEVALPSGHSVLRQLGHLVLLLGLWLLSFCSQESMCSGLSTCIFGGPAIFLRLILLGTGDS